MGDGAVEHVALLVEVVANDDVANGLMLVEHGSLRHDESRNAADVALKYTQKIVTEVAIYGQNDMRGGVRVRVAADKFCFQTPAVGL